MRSSDSHSAVSHSERASAIAPRGSTAEVFRVFLRLGLTSFGGPAAHLGYFRNELVTKRAWVDEAAFGDIVALCQFLPGPASSQVGFVLGILRGGGLLGGLAAWLAFTTPSALIMLAFAIGAGSVAGPAAQGCVHGLKLVAVAVVAQAVWGMSQTLTPDRTRAGIALAAMGVVVAGNGYLENSLGGSFGQVAAIVLGAMAGWSLCRQETVSTAGVIEVPVRRRGAIVALTLFVILLVAPPLGLYGGTLFSAFYRSGALVFGGGHVVLPLLQAQVVAPGWVSREAFLSGYGVAQAAPGPLFTFAAYLGAVGSISPSGLIGGLVALVALFLPGLLLVYGALPFWDGLRVRSSMQAAMRGANAAVVGILAIALYDPVWTSAVTSYVDFVLAVGGFLLLTIWRAPPWVVVLLLAAIGTIVGWMAA